MSPVRVDITNVASWFFEENEENDYANLPFPVILSPWPHAVYHYHTPRYFNEKGHKLPYDAQRGEVIVTITNGLIDDSFRQQLDDLHPDDLETRDAFYLQSASIELISSGRKLDGGEAVFSINQEGGLHKAAYAQNPERRVFDMAWFNPVAFAISLLHCRNVEVRDRPVSRQQRRMAERKGKPGITYKELVIDAFRKQVRYETQGDSGNEIKRALHICRGHFATYDDHNPLFGKYTGTFWRPMHVRGHKEAGEIRKSYKVKGNHHE